MKLSILVLVILLAGCASGPTKMEQVRIDLGICDDIKGEGYIVQGLRGPFLVCRMPKTRCTYNDFFKTLTTE